LLGFQSFEVCRFDCAFESGVSRRSPKELNAAIRLSAGIRSLPLAVPQSNATELTPG
jgi:hypothetical protein